MRYTFKNITLSMGLLDDIDESQGLCRFEIPMKHKEFLRDCCGMTKTGNKEEYEPAWAHEYGGVYYDREEAEFWCTSPDLLIAYMSWLLDSGEDEVIQVEYQHYYWGIHDSLHALNDEAGCTIYVDGHIEKKRLIDGFKIMTDLGYYPDYPMIEEIQNDFSTRFGFEIDLTDFLDRRFEDDDEDY